MEQYTLLVMDTNKVVYIHTFLTMNALLDYKRYILDKDIELQQVDREGYVWFAEVNEEDK